MQRAAHGLAYAVLDLLGRGYGARVLLLVGAGDNGGDALHAGAVLARRGAGVEAVLLAPGKAHAAGLAALTGAGGRVVAIEDAERPDVVVDGIVGHRRAARAARRGRRGARAARRSAGRRGRPAVRCRRRHRRARRTARARHADGHLRHPQGRAAGGPGGRGPRARSTSSTSASGRPATTATRPSRPSRQRTCAALLPEPDGSAHKYSRGVVGVRTGSARYPGAAVLSVAGAGCGLAGMVRYDGGAADHVLAAHPETVAGDGRVQAWVVGSGGGDDAAEALARSRRDGVPVVVDADALAAVDGPFGGPAVLTPHAGELARDARGSTGSRSRPRRCGTPAKRPNGTTPSCCSRAAARSSPTRTAGRGSTPPACRGSRRPGRATCWPAWSARCWPAAPSPFDAASVGAWLHGAAATLASDDGPLTASAVAAAIPEAVREPGGTDSLTGARARLRGSCP